MQRGDSWLLNGLAVCIYPTSISDGVWMAKGSLHPCGGCVVFLVVFHLGQCRYST